MADQLKPKRKWLQFLSHVLILFLILSSVGCSSQDPLNQSSDGEQNVNVISPQINSEEKKEPTVYQINDDLNVSVIRHKVQNGEETIFCCTYLSDGFSKLNQKELSLTLVHDPKSGIEEKPLKY